MGDKVASLLNPDSPATLIPPIVTTETIPEITTSSVSLAELLNRVREFVRCYVVFASPHQVTR